MKSINKRINDAHHELHTTGDEILDLLQRCCVLDKELKDLEENEAKYLNGWRMKYAIRDLACSISEFSRLTEDGYWYGDAVKKLY